MKKEIQISNDIDLAKAVENLKDKERISIKNK
jgi:hypothetical protein